MEDDKRVPTEEELKHQRSHTEEVVEETKTPVKPMTIGDTNPPSQPGHKK